MADEKINFSSVRIMSGRKKRKTGRTYREEEEEETEVVPG
jgi:hypothetical protein